MSNDNHIICERCWFARPDNARWSGDVLEWVRLPVCYKPENPEDAVRICCFCAHPTIMGAAVTHDPTRLACQRYGYHPEDPEDDEEPDEESKL